MLKEERLKKKILKNAKLTTVEDTIVFINKFVSKMNKRQLEGVREHVLDKPDNDAKKIWLQLIDERLKVLK